MPNPGSTAAALGPSALEAILGLPDLSQLDPKRLGSTLATQISMKERAKIRDAIEANARAAEEQRFLELRKLLERRRNPLLRLLDSLTGRDEAEARRLFPGEDPFGFETSERRDIGHFNESLSRHLDQQDQNRQRLERNRLIEEGRRGPFFKPRPQVPPRRQILFLPARAALDAETFLRRRAQALGIGGSFQVPTLGLSQGLRGTIF